MQVLRVDRTRQFDRMRGAADVDRRVSLGGSCHVVHGRKMEEVLDLAAQLGHLFLVDAEQRPAQVADHGLHALGG